MIEGNQHKDPTGNVTRAPTFSGVGDCEQERENQKTCGRTASRTLRGKSSNCCACVNKFVRKVPSGHVGQNETHQQRNGAKSGIEGGRGGSRAGQGVLSIAIYALGSTSFKLLPMKWVEAIHSKFLNGALTKVVWWYEVNAMCRTPSFVQNNRLYLPVWPTSPSEIHGGRP